MVCRVRRDNAKPAGRSPSPAKDQPMVLACRPPAKRRVLRGFRLAPGPKPARVRLPRHDPSRNTSRSPAGSSPWWRACRAGR